MNAISFLCAAASAVSAVLLWRLWLRVRTPDLRSIAIAFGFIAGSNVLFFLDQLGVWHVDLVLMRQILTLAGVGCLVAGLASRTQS